LICSAGQRKGNVGKIVIYFVSNQSAASPPVFTQIAGLGGAAGTEGLAGTEGPVGANPKLSDFNHSSYDPGNPPNVGAKGSTGAGGGPGANGAAAVAGDFTFLQVATI
jgi:hypothetical protein